MVIRPISRRALLAGAAATLLAACRTGGADATASGAEPGGVSTTGTGIPNGTNGSVPASPVTSAPAAPTATPATTAVPATSPAGGPAVFVDHGDRSRPEAALTFHTNGDPASVTALLDVLGAKRVPATFFVIGEWAVANPGLVRRLVADGHEVANHTWSHLPMGSQSRPVLAEEIVRCRDALAALGAGPVRWFRPSGIDVPTADILAEAGAAGYATSVGYDVDPLDYQDPPVADVVAATAATMAAGSIVSLHTGHDVTVAALPGVLDVFAARSLRPVTCSTLLR